MLSEDIVVCLCGTVENRLDLDIGIQTLGGMLMSEYDASLVTHLVVINTDNYNYQQWQWQMSHDASRQSVTNTVLVKSSWLVASISAGNWLPENDFLFIESEATTQSTSVQGSEHGCDDNRKPAALMPAELKATETTTNYSPQTPSTSTNSSEISQHTVGDGLARTPPIQLNPYFIEWREIDDRPCRVFREITETFQVEIDHTELIGKIHAVYKDGELRVLKRCPEWKEGQADWLHNLFVDVKPEHIALRNTHALKIGTLPCDLNESGQKGRRADDELDLIAKWRGVCKCNKCRDKDFRLKSAEDKCTTTYIAGIPLSEAIKYAQAVVTTKIIIMIQFFGSCVHRRGEPKGEISGLKRKRMKKKVRLTHVFHLLHALLTLIFFFLV